MSQEKLLAFETRFPILYTYRNPSIGANLTISLNCSGEIRWQIQDEEQFRLLGPSGESRFPAFEDRLRSEVLLALMAVLADFAARGIPYETLAGQNEDLSREMLSRLAPDWEKQGMLAETFCLTEVSLSPKDEEMISQLKKQAELLNPSKAVEALLKAQAEALKAVEGWKCEYCGSLNKGKFCPNCGSKRPE